MHWIIKSPLTPGQSGPGSNSDHGLLHLPQISKTGATLSEEILRNMKDTCIWKGSYPSAEGTVHIFFAVETG